MFEQVRKQAVRGSGKRTFLAVLILLLGLTLTVWTSVTDLFPKNGPWSPMDNPDAYRIAEAAEQSRSVYMDLRQMPLYGTGFELGEGAFARAICLTSRTACGFRWSPGSRFTTKWTITAAPTAAAAGSG